MSGQIRPSETPSFDLQKHHSKVRVPTEFDLKDLARKYHVFPLRVIHRDGKKRLLLAMRNPGNQSAIYDVEFKAGLTVIAVQADEIDIQWLIQKHYYGRQLSPTPNVKTPEITHDLFEQLAITTDAQKRPDWVNDSIHRFNDEQLKK